MRRGLPPPCFLTEIAAAPVHRFRMSLEPELGMTTQRLQIVENGMAPGLMPERLSQAALDVRARAFKPTAADRTPGREHNRPRKNGPYSQGIAHDFRIARPCATGRPGPKQAPLKALIRDGKRPFRSVLTAGALTSPCNPRLTSGTETPEKDT